MDDAVIAALAKWPNVPACYGWITLDARGRWRLGQAGTTTEIVRHTGLANFLARNYACTAQGEWFCQNGPQRVYVTLDYAPWSLHIDAQRILTHTGLNVSQIERALVDEHGCIYLVTEHGLGVLDDRELPSLLATLSTPDGRPCDEATLDGLCQGIAHDIIWQSPLGPQRIDGTHSSQLESAYGFIRQPQPPGLQLPVSQPPSAP